MVGTPQSKKTRFGKVPDFYKASNELDERDVGELVDDIADYEEDIYGGAQEVARAFHEDDSEKYNRNQMLVRETAKEEVDKHSQPGWAWELLSVYSEDMGTRLLDVPSDGSSKGLLIDEEFETAFLYPKKADGISAVDHVRRWYDNGVNAQSIGYDLPAEDMERTALDIGQEETGVPVLAMDYNAEMVLDSKISDFMEGNKDLELQDREAWVKDQQPARTEFLESRDIDNIDDWITGLEFLIDNDYLENWGAIEYRRGKDNTAIDPENGERIIVDLGEYRVEDEENDSEDRDLDPNIQSNSGSHSLIMSGNSSRSTY